MDKNKLKLTREKYRLPHHWIRDPLDRDSIVYFGYATLIIDELPDAPALVLDAGCGSGRIAAEMIRKGYQVKGIDYLELNALYANQLVPEGAFYQGDLRNSLVDGYPWEPNTFDAVTLIEVYEHIPPEDCPQVLKNIDEALTPHGKFIITVPSKDYPTVSDLHYRHFTREEFQHELVNAGFKVQKIIFQHSLTPFNRWVMYGWFDTFLFNRWIQPIVLQRLRRKWYMRFANQVKQNTRCGRFIAVATK